MPKEWERYCQLARKQKVVLINLQQQPPAPNVLRYQDIAFYRREGCLPWQQQNGGLVVACKQLNASTKARLEAHFQQNITLAYCTPRDHRHALEQRFGKRFEQDALTRILRDMPQFSAYHTTSSQQKAFLSCLFILLGTCLLCWPQSTLIAFIAATNLLYIASIAFKCWLYKHSGSDALRDKSPMPELEDASLPVYSILIPMYREVESVPRLLNAIRALDYPKDKLDVKLVIEADDRQTYRAIIRNQPEACFDIIRVPPSNPRTKPKACSYALTFARGDYVTIYDAEDRPEPSQLRQAVAAFRAAPNDVMCLQGRLNYYNRDENFLTRCFAIEYANLFDLMLPGLQKLGIPIPLGGTSNHLHLARLRELKDWDPYNVTEDADLGIRLAMHGYRTQMLDSVTMEEAPIALVPWLKQRTRWIKGYMQTWLVYMRQPTLLRQTLGARGYWGFHLFIGAPCLIFLLSPLLWGFSALWMAGMVPMQLAAPLVGGSVSCFALGYLTQVFMARRSIVQWKWRYSPAMALLYPFYWFLHAIASLRALAQLVIKPHYWDKTSHGKTKLKNHANALDTPKKARYKPVSI